MLRILVLKANCKLFRHLPGQDRLVAVVAYLHLLELCSVLRLIIFHLFQHFFRVANEPTSQRSPAIGATVS